MVEKVPMSLQSSLTVTARLRGVVCLRIYHILQKKSLMITKLWLLRPLLLLLLLLRQLSQLRVLLSQRLMINRTQVTDQSTNHTVSHSLSINLLYSYSTTPAPYVWKLHPLSCLFYAMLILINVSSDWSSYTCYILVLCKSGYLKPWSFP